METRSASRRFTSTASFQNLRGAGLIRLEGGALDVLNWEELKRAGDFDPTYLHLENREAA